MTLTTGTINLRAELRLALLAAAEACWLYAIVLTIGSLMGFSRVVSPFGIFIVYWTGLLVGRALPNSNRAWRVLQALTVVFALLAILVAMRVGFYAEPFYDFSWVAIFFGRIITLLERVTAEEISLFVLVAAFVRALGFAQRPLTLWVIGFQFRLGIVIFFAMAFIAALSTRVDFILWIFVYFALSLTGISLARIEEAGREQALGYRWALVLSTTIAATMLLGFGATQFLTLESVNAFFAFFSPLYIILAAIVSIISIPVFYLFDILGNILASIISLMRFSFPEFFKYFNFDMTPITRVVDQVVKEAINLVPYLRLVATILFLVLIGWFIAITLNRRMKWREQLIAANLEDADQQVILKNRKSSHATYSKEKRVHAENVRRIYAALQLHAERLGLKRKEAETPFEFLPRLVARFPDAARDIENITRAYCGVHYAMQDATEAQVRELRAVWQRAKQQMTNDERQMTKR